MTRAEFLAASPRELALLFDEELHTRLEPAALMCCLLANIHRDPEKRERPFAVADFLPGSDGDGEFKPVDDNEPDEEMKAFIDAIQRGEKMEQTPESIEVFKTAIASYLEPAADVGKSTMIGPRGVMERA